MDDRLEQDGNWLLMFPVSSLIWKETKSWFMFPLVSCFQLSVEPLGIQFIYMSLQQFYLAMHKTLNTESVGLAQKSKTECKTNFGNYLKYKAESVLA